MMGPCAFSVILRALHRSGDNPAHSSEQPELESSSPPNRWRALMPQCHLAVVASGTVTLEGAICTPPHGDHLRGLADELLAGPRTDQCGAHRFGQPDRRSDRIVPELVQHEVTPKAISRNGPCAIIVRSARLCTPNVPELSMVRDRLGQSGASHKVAQIACAP
jgi:lipid A disaccharide synthetase